MGKDNVSFVTHDLRCSFRFLTEDKMGLNLSQLKDNPNEFWYKSLNESVQSNTVFIINTLQKY